MADKAAMDSSYEMAFLHADADGVGPALILSAPKGAAQYLFNVPEGFARLALEKKMRPSSHLSCVCLTSIQPHTAGGLGGLMLRLAQDGHGQVQLIGPKGTGQFVHALRHICHWRHPKVFVSECHSTRPLPVFDDDHTVIIPLMAGDQFSSCPWCSYNACLRSEATNPRMKWKKVLLTSIKKNSTTSSSGSSSSSSSDWSADDAEVFDIKSRKRKSELGSGHSTTSIEGVSKKMKNKVLHCEGTLVGNSKQVDSSLHSENCNNQVFRELDALFTQHDCAKKTMKRKAMNKLKKVFECNASSCLIAVKGRQIHQTDERLAGSSIKNPSFSDHSSSFCAKDSLRLNGSTENHPLYSRLDALFTQNSFGKRSLKRKAIGTLNKAKKCSSSCSVHHKVRGNNSIAVQASKETNMEANSVVCNLNSAYNDGIRQPQDTGTDVDGKSLISNIVENDLPSLQEESNPVFLKDPSGLSAIDSSEEDNYMLKGKHNHVHIFGYLCYLKKLHAGVLIIDCCSNESLKSIELHRIIKCMGSDMDFHKIIAVIHLTPIWLQKSELYKLWTKSFRKNILHFSVRGSFQEFGFISSLSTLLKLNLVSDRLFPLPFAMKPMVKKKCQGSSDQRKKKKSFEKIKVPVNVIIEKKGSNICTRFDNSKYLSRSNTFSAQDSLLQVRPSYACALQQCADMLYGDPCLTVNQKAALALRKELLLQRGLLLQQETNMTPPNQCSESPTGGRFQIVLAQDAKSYSSKLSSIDVPIQGRYLEQNESSLEDVLVFRENPPLRTLDAAGAGFEVVFLGTGSAEPSKYRGSSGILLKIQGCNASMLLDAGEGVVGQLVRLYGKQGAFEVLASLCCVWVSHKHADHVLGIYSVICARQGHGSLTIIGPSTVKNWLSEVSRVSGDIFPLSAYNYIHSKEFSVRQQGVNPNFTLSSGQGYQIQQMLDQLQLRNMKSVYVDHCYEAYGLVLFSNSGWSVVYSGDTRPCEQLIQAGIGCTLLIHEATFEDNLYGHAMQKRHSTVEEALNSAFHMHAQNVILTHFSQRYPKIVNIRDAGELNVFVAFDVTDPSNKYPFPVDGEMPATILPDQVVMTNTLVKTAPLKGISIKNEGGLNSQQSGFSKHIRWADSNSDSEDG
ncbi:hypothetical protein O6H91_10G006100 [Diphasiastrum complanatum]|uniref:Uncharacterized protein n=1 Tax=Diphasiastrum complanatum TaxID=34168 RepID=A0ACC2CDZ3_DIPCM|nr:hypothetical protein O6H91_10G006100 [Diphasiastrum complanatum]